MSEFDDINVRLGGLGLGCCLTAGVLYLLGRSSGREAEVLESVSRVNSLKDLAQLVDTASKALPLVVTVSGIVGADSPISCKYSDLSGVIVQETAKQHFLKPVKEVVKCDKVSWIRDSELMLSTCKEVPWYLDDRTGRAYVVGARRADGFCLTHNSEVFKEPVTSDCVKDLKMLGVTRAETVLPTGTPLTVVGEAVKDGIGTVRIQKPHEGPFYVLYDKTIDHLIANHGEWARFYRIASAGFAVFGVCLLASLVAQPAFEYIMEKAQPAFEYILEKRRHWEMRKRVLAAAAKRQGRYNNGSHDRRDGSVSELCMMCLEQNCNSVFVPCGHMCCCSACSSHLTNCPLCQRWIKQAIWTYRH